MGRRYFPLAALFAAALAAGASKAEESSDLAAVRELLRREYDKPSEPLHLDAIAIVNDSAIADWSQGELAGRAFLRRKDEKWSIALCAGDALKKVDALAKLGLPMPQAEALADKLTEAERGLSRETLENIARFDRMVEMDSAADRSPSDPHHRVQQ
ncbi:MAG TPA: copper uptake system-associated protein [Methylocystis sp.]|nr:copper uptake system-associated protein [Methylocystis sp.]